MKHVSAAASGTDEFQIADDDNEGAATLSEETLWLVHIESTLRVVYLMAHATPPVCRAFEPRVFKFAGSEDLYRSSKVPLRQGVTRWEIVAGGECGWAHAYRARRSSSIDLGVALPWFVGPTSRVIREFPCSSMDVFADGVSNPGTPEAPGAMWAWEV
ncbi:uncharacterized protein N7459_004963 [Penicillium hispanicum]|uniref:uncharacterized protein n=1 Tax=Penicillium hispanicum TaxID=1080232 RepID=UPI00254005EF|nr:uncharacterized protein N7459_004963 [Penicillium hispanicum]KAJ5585163.1 hypothetical protein N7459_004963 [Penicillium hispanicum]